MVVVMVGERREDVMKVGSSPGAVDTPTDYPQQKEKVCVCRGKLAMGGTEAFAQGCTKACMPSRASRRPMCA